MTSQLNLETIYRFVSKAKSKGLSEVILTGGGVSNTLYDEISINNPDVKIVNWTKENNLRLLLCTTKKAGGR